MLQRREKRWSGIQHKRLASVDGEQTLNRISRNNLDDDEMKMRIERVVL